MCLTEMIACIFLHLQKLTLKGGLGGFLDRLFGTLLAVIMII